MRGARLLFVASPKPAILIVLACALAAFNQAQTAASHDATLRDEAQKIENAWPAIPDRGAALFLLAKRYAQLGDTRKSLALLKECLALNEGFDPTDTTQFEPLRSWPEFRTLSEAAHRRYPQVHHARVAFTVSESDLFPEGLAVDWPKKLFYMGSMYRKKIVCITSHGDVSDFVPADAYNLMPVGGVKVDPADHSVWAATDPGEESRSELVHFDASGKLIERYPAPGPGPHDLNDLVLRGQREIFTTDSFAHRVYRFDRRTHEFTALVFPRLVLLPNGIALSGDGHLLYAADVLGVSALDLRNNLAREVLPGKGTTLAGIDGLYWYKNSLVGVQYGTGYHRVMRWRLDSTGTRVVASEILEARSPLTSFPTTGAIAGSDFYFIANTGIGNLHDGKIADPAKLDPIHIAVIPLR